ncbi:MAG: PD-(D/E)XK nuclease family protein [Patescibacteria group bacterium]
MYKLSPSDFGYLWNDCKHCFYQKIKHGITLPSIGMPGVFSKMNSLLQGAIMGMNLKDVNSELPSGIIEVKEGFLRSKPIPPKKDCFISGRFDIISKLKDGSIALIDFKITDPTEERIQKYSNQLHGYKFALENPAYGESKKVTKMGIIAVNPEEISFPGEKVIFNAVPKWFEISQDMDSFSNFISEISDLLNAPAPKENPDCNWCKYRLCFAKPNEEQEKIPF